MNAQEIANAIAKLVEHRNVLYDEWTIGVTDNPGRRRKRHVQDGHDMTWWSKWNASSEQAARSVEKYFVDKGMQGDTGGRGSADFSRYA